MDPLTREDIAILIEAVAGWTAKGPPIPATAAALIFGCESPENARKELDAIKRQIEDDGRLRNERGVMLQAKLIQIRDGMAADAVLNEARRRQ